MQSEDARKSTSRDTAHSTARWSRRRRWTVAGLLILLLVVMATYFSVAEYAYQPGETALNSERMASAAYDVWGRAISAEEAESLQQTEEGHQLLSPANGAVRIDQQLLALSEQAFYEETFGNEVFLTDVLGAVDGPLSLTAVTKAVLQARGAGTSNLQVELAEAATVGGRSFEKGSLVSTGLDVPRGAFAPLGMKVRKEHGRILVGITCAACHSSVDPQTMRVVHGMPNVDLRAGLILAMGTNTAAYFPHANVEDLEPLITDSSPTVVTTRGEEARLPDAQALEDAVDAALLKWPPGNFDSMVDLKGDPTQLPSSFTREAHPFSWSGMFAAGPFRGLSAQNNNVHGLNSDALTSAALAEPLFGIDPEVYLGLSLQRAANPKYRYYADKHRKPSEFLASIDPTAGQPALNELVALPTYPKGSLLSPNGVWVGSPGYRVWEQMNAMSAWQDTLVPPPPRLEADEVTLAMGKDVFDRAGCGRCHSGPALTNHRVIAAQEIGTEPTRARAMKRAEGTFDAPIGYAFDERVPLREGAKQMEAPTDLLNLEDVTLSLAWRGTEGGYKVPALVGLSWTAPYLHDGGVAVGKDEEREIGMPGTLLQDSPADPQNSLRALVDRALRGKVIAANRANADLKEMHVEGIGHEFWVDEAAGFTPAEQSALVMHLLHYRIDADDNSATEEAAFASGGAR